MSKSHSLTLFLLFTFLSFPAAAQSIKSVTLNDGSILKGEVRELKNGVYTILTENLGTVNIKDTDIASISSQGHVAASAQNQPNLNQMNSMFGGMDLGGLLNNPQIMGQMMSLQQTLMSDPQMMTEIQKLMEDENVMQLISDPNLMMNLLNGDPSQIQNNKQVNELLNNPQIKNLIERIQPTHNK
ncbi:MAG: hypothetical protein H6755_02790 [Candidatus Omnitrophica bacterium]|nr:hypothetical protein [Candidatus Omnitrophota bacterium]